jgi:hypothetical protein
MFPALRPESPLLKCDATQVSGYTASGSDRYKNYDQRAKYTTGLFLATAASRMPESKEVAGLALRFAMISGEVDALLALH